MAVKNLLQRKRGAIPLFLAVGFWLSVLFSKVPNPQQATQALLRSGSLFSAG